MPPAPNNRPRPFRHLPIRGYGFRIAASAASGMTDWEETPMTQKIAIVTGAGTGVGRAAALALMREGFTVVLAGRRQEMLDAVAKEGAQTPGAALTVQTDVADPASIKALVAKTKATYGRLDLLFNNAGIGTPATSIEDMPFDKWQAVGAPNLTGVL